MKRSKLHILLLGLVFLGGCSAHLLSTKVPQSPASGAKSELDGLFYSLPQTVVTVKLPVSVTKVKAGKHQAYKDLFFPGAQSPTPKTAIGSPEFSVRGVADPRQVYLVKATGRGALEQTLTFGFQEDGAVTGIKAEVENVSGDLVISGFKGLVGIATRTLYSGAAQPSEDPDAEKDFCDKTSRDDLKKEPFSLQTTFFVDCVLREEGEGELVLNFLDHPNSAERDRLVRNYFTSDKAYRDFQRALATYGQISELVRGQHTALQQADGGPKEDVILAQNKAQVAQLMQQFIGVSAKYEWTGHFDLLPPECDADRASKCSTKWTSAPLVSYVPNDGLCSFLGANHRGKPPSPKMITAKCTKKNQHKIVLSLDPVPDQVAFRLADNYKQPSEAGLFFIVPLGVNARLQDQPPVGKDSPLPGDTQLSIAQRGVVAALPSRIGGKAFTHDIEYFGASGALKSYVLASEPLVDKGAVDSLSGSLNDLLDARNAQRKAEASADFDALKRETEAVELLVRQQEACAKLPNPPENCEGL